MGKTDSFFIRAKVVGTPGAFAQESIDLGAYVDALGKSVLRVHNIAVQTYEILGQDWSIPANSAANVTWQLTTQSQSALVDASNKSVVATGSLNLSNTTTTANVWSAMTDAPDVMPQMWRNGYLIGVEQIYLGTEVDPQLSNGEVVVVMECTVETLSQSAAMALALSQQ
jgi:hypothetical protein